jgi:hypothetical protein
MAIASLSNDAFDKMTSLLNEPSPEINFSSIAKVIGRAIPDVPPANVQSVMRAIHDDERGSAKITADFVDSVAAQLAAEKINPNVLRQRLTTIQHIRQLAAIYKANSLLVRNERNFVSASTVTDLRPIFAADVDEPPMAFAMENHLEIRYRHPNNGAYESFFVALDESDVDDLIAVLQRAKEKCGSMKRYLEGSRIPYFLTNRR